MNSTLCISNDTLFNEVLLGQEAVANENIYITELMPAIKKSAYQQSDEEELHSSFEEAISERVLTLHTRLSCLSNPIQYIERNTDPVLSTATTTKNTTAKPVQITDRLEQVSRPTVAWRRATTLTCSAMMFLLLGFDVIDLLVLHIH